MKRIIIFLTLVIILAGLGFWYWRSGGQTRNNFRTAEVVKGRLIATIGATGTLEPEEVVDIGAQVAGRIEELGEDPSDKAKTINWGSAVDGPYFFDQNGMSAASIAGLFSSSMGQGALLGAVTYGNTQDLKIDGTLLAKIDPAIYDAQVKAAKADVKKAEADLKQKTALFNQANEDWARAQNLFKKEPPAIAKSEYDAAKAAYETTDANIDVSKAMGDSAKAALILAETNLKYTRITAPAKGVIIDRRVNVGQTVVASLSAPSLFLLAKDLSKMEVWATVNEADVGKTYVGQDVTFTVDAYPGEMFKGKVKAQGKYPARLNASMTSNVVVYTVVVSADNSPQPGYPMGKLWPYLTANLSFIVSDRESVKLVPNAALRWQPARHQIHADFRDAYAKLKSKKKAPTEVEKQERGFVWVVVDNFVKPIQVNVGMSDGISTEIMAGLGDSELPDGTQVVTGEGRSDSGSSGSTNPFAPPPFGGKKKSESQ